MAVEEAYGNLCSLRRAFGFNSPCFQVNVSCQAASLLESVAGKSVEETHAYVQTNTIIVVMTVEIISNYEVLSCLRESRHGDQSSKFSNY